MRLSLALGVQLSQLGRVLTAPEWAEYMAADAAGLIPDHGFYRDAILAMAKARTEQPPQDLMAGYRRRKAMYGHQAKQNRRTTR